MPLHTLAALYLLLSAVTLLVYALDKSAARRRQWRIPENLLHLLALLGGWPGALVAQRLLRHKTQKTSFRAVFWMTITANCAVLAWLLFGSPMR